VRHLAACRIAAVAFVAATALARGMPSLSAAGPRVDEYAVKAAMLFNFARFIEWPPATFASPATPLDVCILGVDPFGDRLESTFKGHSLNGRPLRIRRIADAEPGCHVAFIALSERKRLPLLVERLRAGGSTLTVSESEGFGDVGGMIELLTADDTVAFNIFPAALERSKLRASARLTALAANQKRTGDHQ
jgi:hypothetical protein